MKLLLTTLFSLSAFCMMGQASKDLQIEIVTKIAELKDVRSKIVVRDEHGGDVAYMRCTEVVQVCEEMIPTQHVMLMLLEKDSLDVLGVNKYLDVKMIGAADSIASCHFSLIGANLPENRRPKNCSANFVLDKEKGWIMSAHNCRD